MLSPNPKLVRPGRRALGILNPCGSRAVNGGGGQSSKKKNNNYWRWGRGLLTCVTWCRKKISDQRGGYSPPPFWLLYPWWICIFRDLKLISDYGAKLLQELIEAYAQSPSPLRESIDILQLYTGTCIISTAEAVDNVCV